MQKTHYNNDKPIIYYADKALSALRTDNLRISKELFDDFLKKIKHKEIQEIRDLLIEAELCIEQAKNKLDNILENLA